MPLTFTLFKDDGQFLIKFLTTFIFVELFLFMAKIGPILSITLPAT